MEEIRLLLLTIAIELPVAMVFLPSKLRMRAIPVVICMNMVTHPLAWQAVSFGVSWWLVEGAVAIAEALIFAGLFPSIRVRAAVTALGANIVTAAIGFFFF
jgi:hypothetical protein